MPTPPIGDIASPQPFQLAVAIAEGAQYPARRNRASAAGGAFDPGIIDVAFDAVGSITASEGDLVSPLTGSGTVTRAGWTAGAGVEAKIDNRWSAKLEYLYVDLGSFQAFTEPFIPGTTVAETATFRTHLLRGGFNYRFN